MTTFKQLDVFLHQDKIATLTLLPDDRIYFNFVDSYIQDQQRATLSLAFKNKTGELLTDFKPTRTKLHTFFSNLLPEGNLREYLAQQAGVNPAREFFLLEALGQDLPGALTVAKSIDNYAVPQHDQFHAVNEAEKLEDTLRFSLAGVQLKFSAVMQASGGLTIPAKGIGGSWIIKLPSMHFPQVPENEYSMLKLAGKLGINVPEVKLVPASKITNIPISVKSTDLVFAIKRFDRTDSGQMIHAEDFAQVFQVYPQDKYKRANYKNIAEVINLEIGNDGVAEFIRRLTFNTLIGNADMHLKNWSLIYPDGKHAAIAPAYDFVSTIAYLSDDYMGLNYLPGIKKRSDFSLELLTRFAVNAGLSKHLVLETATHTTTAFLDHWATAKQELPLTKLVISKIDQNLRTIPLANEI